MARHALFALLLGLGVTLAMPAGIADQSTTPKDDEYYELYKVLVDTIDQVDRNYVQNLSRREIIDAAIHGILEKLDPYSSYISPEEMTRFRDDVEHKFGGIGIQISMENGQLIVLSPLVGSPAYRAGLHAGDRIVKIEGDPTEGITIDEAVKKLKGDSGTDVTLSLRHLGSPEPEDVTLTREVVSVATVLGDSRKKNDAWDWMYDHELGIGYIRITAFSRETASDLRDALNALEDEGLHGLVIDLRFNPGGLLTSAIEICDMFIDEGRIVSTQGRNTPERIWDAKAPGTFSGFPMAIIVNRYSASASEILSACLQDHHRAIIVGERTWGKGSVQNVVELEGGTSALKLTTASYRRPSGKNIHRFPDATEEDEWGVMPNDDYLIRLTPNEMRQLVMIRRDRDIVQWHAKDAPAQENDAKADETEPPSDSPQGDETNTEPSDENEGEQSDGGGEEFVDRQFEAALGYIRSQLTGDHFDDE